MKISPEMYLLQVANYSLLFHKRSWLLVGLLVGLLGAMVLFSLSVGSGNLTIWQVINTLLGQGSSVEQLILFKIRLPRITAVIIAGAAMGLSGCLVQTLVRNRLATPDMMGVNNGSSLMIIIFSLYLTLGVWPWWAAPLGALLTAAALYLLTRGRHSEGYLFVVIGIGVSELVEAISQFIMSTQSLVHLRDIYLWNMGNFIAVSPVTLVPISVSLLLIMPWVIYTSRSLSLLRFCPQLTKGLGVNVSALELAVLTQAIIITGLGTAIGGPVVFIAMAAPIFASGLVKGRTVPLWLSALLGAILLLASDTLVRVLADPHEVATGIMTRMLGGLLLLVILLNDRNKGSV